MSKLIIEGGYPLQGSVTPSGNKNAALPLLAASLLTDEPVVLENVPRIRDVETMLQLLTDLGVEVAVEGNTVYLQARAIRKVCPDPELFGRIRGSLTLMGPMLAREGRIRLLSPGGDAIGRRRIDTHLLALGALGARLEYDGRFELHVPDRLRGQDILLDEASVTATENAIMAAALAEGTTVLRNAASEPHVQDLCRCINQMGGRITGIGSNTLVIEGVPRLKGTKVTLSPDFLEIGSFIGLGAVTEGEIRIRGVIPDQLRMICMVFRDRLGVRMHFEESDGITTLVVEDGQELVVRPDLGGAVPKIDDGPWPAFPADLISIALVVATQARGTVLIHEKMYESRLYFVDKLIAMGAQIILCDPHRAVVVGPSQLVAQPMSSPDIRAGMAMIIAGLCAQGESMIGNVGQIDRGYERLDEKLRALGARIRRVD
jgi:UDP-N-acetylglucosamine 1-carboxyvinyltransferase